MAVPETASHSSSSPYRGRFAPSPTGPLHLGSIVAALASFLDARANGGRWLVRMEDLDPPRESPGAADLILRTLEQLQLHWDEPVLYQSTRSDAYRAALECLREQDLVYACRCSRLELGGSTVYPGTCRNLGLEHTAGTALRCRVPHARLDFTDLLQGRQSQQLDTEVGDFVLLRKDGYFAYQLAVVVDDGWQGITDVVRGCDLLDSTPRQLFLQHCLQLPQPRYAHIPLVINAQGQKLGKQQYSPAVDTTRPATVIWHALALLGQQPEPAWQRESPASLLQWAIAHWQPGRLSLQQTVAEPDTSSAR